MTACLDSLLLFCKALNLVLGINGFHLPLVDYRRKLRASE